MTLQEAQQNVDQWIKTKGVRYFSELTNMAILAEEVGEVARLMTIKSGRWERVRVWNGGVSY